MNSRQDNSRQDLKSIHPDLIVEGLAGVRWYVRTTRHIDRQRHAIHLLGYLNPLRASCITIVSASEMEWMYAQTEQSLSGCAVFRGEIVSLVILCAGCEASPALVAVCERYNIALVKTSVGEIEVVDYLMSHLPKLIALRKTKHGVFLAVMNTGILITGSSGVGKSEVAMDLIQRGHQLVADDAVDIYRSEQNELVGECPATLRGYIEIRGLGIISILKMFGPSAVLDFYRLQLIIDLQEATDSEVKKVDRLSPSLEMRDILGIQMPCLTMLVAPGRNLAVLVEAAVRNHLLRMSGMDSGKEFLLRHDEIMKKKTGV